MDSRGTLLTSILPSQFFRSLSDERGKLNYPARQRFFDKVSTIRGGCHVWRASSNGRYGFFFVNGKQRYAHRVSYEDARGIIPDGLVIDHLCRNTKCVNPDHLQAVTPYVNWERTENATTIAFHTNTCKRGHSLADAYLSPRKNGTMHRTCKACHRIRFMDKSWHSLKGRMLSTPPV